MSYSEPPRPFSLRFAPASPPDGDSGHHCRDLGGRPRGAGGRRAGDVRRRPRHELLHDRQHRRGVHRGGPDLPRRPDHVRHRVGRERVVGPGRPGQPGPRYRHGEPRVSRRERRRGRLGQRRDGLGRPGHPGPGLHHPRAGARAAGSLQHAADRGLVRGNTADRVHRRLGRQRNGALRLLDAPPGVRRRGRLPHGRLADEPGLGSRARDRRERGADPARRQPAGLDAAQRVRRMVVLQRFASASGSPRSRSPSTASPTTTP